MCSSFDSNIESVRGYVVATRRSSADGLSDLGSAGVGWAPTVRIGAATGGDEWIRTRLFILPRPYLWVNVECEHAAQIRFVVYVYGNAANVSSAFRARSDMLVGINKTAIAVPFAPVDQWRIAVASRAGRVAEIKAIFVGASCCRLYSFWFSDSDSRGASRGYVAGGGPAYDTFMDT